MFYHVLSCFILMCFARAIFFGKKKHGGLDAKMQRCLPKALPDPWHGAQCARSMCSQSLSLLCRWPGTGYDFYKDYKAWKHFKKQRKTDGNKKIKIGDGPDG